MNPNFRKKSAARLQAVQAIYLCLMRPNVSTAEALRDCSSAQSKDIDVDKDFCRALLLYWDRHKNSLTQVIGQHLTKSWSLERLDRVLYAIIQGGTAELYAFKDTATALTVTEYLDITHAFFQGPEHKIVNGILHAVAQNR